MAGIDNNQVESKKASEAQTTESEQPDSEAAQQQKPPGQMTDEQARGWSMLCHLGAFAGLIIPLGNIIAPLVFWFIKKEESAFVDDQGKESLNFQISLTIYFLIAGIAGMFVWLLLGRVLLSIVGIFGIVFVIIAAVKANRGEKYRYPRCIRFIK